jgi:hypothetical protein
MSIIVNTRLSHTDAELLKRLADERKVSQYELTRYLLTTQVHKLSHA